MGLGYWWGPSFGMMWIFPLLCFVFMIAMLVMIFRRAGGCMPMGRQSSDVAPDTRESPRQILDRRLASGELTLEQYNAMRRDLEPARGVP